MQNLLVREKKLVDNLTNEHVAYRKNSILAGSFDPLIYLK
jgi:dihydroorotase